MEMTTSTEYAKFLAKKTESNPPTGFDAAALPDFLFDFQTHIVKWGLRKGRAAIFAECGLGKTLMQLEMGRQCANRTSLPSLILAPLSVKEQTIAEAKKFGYGSDNIIFSNYERVSEHDPSEYGCIILDESSILKNFMGVIRNAIIDRFVSIPYRFAFTATPSPNDVVELGNHSEFLGVKTRKEMLATWFINDAEKTDNWRLKGHAANSFWRWVASWAVCVGDPSDLGYDASAYVLPELRIHRHDVADSGPDESKGILFDYGSANATEYNAKLRKSSDARMDAAIKLVAGDAQWIVWVHHNAEAEALERAIPGSVNVHGAMAPGKKASLLLDFANGDFRVLITKQKIAGLGMNFQNCQNQLFTALDFSFEQFYQAVRRSWRFGQKNAVNIHFYAIPEMQNIETILDKKAQAFNDMRAHMRVSMQMNHNDASNTGLSQLPNVASESGGMWEMMNGDCVALAPLVPDCSVDFSIFSPPFVSLFVYSDMQEDMGNCATKQEFFGHYKFLARELLRMTRDGRLCAMHVSNFPIFKWQEGKTGLYDFRGDCIRAMIDCGWTFHSEITVWKDPVVEMQRTKTQGLLYKQLRKDSTYSRVGIPDYVIVFRKVVPESGGTELAVAWKNYDNFPVDMWQKYASPVWMDIRQTNVLNVSAARENEDEKHVCPLQLDLIERCVELWSNPGELVFSPFAGVGSEGHVSVKAGRRFLGIELKESYFRQAIRNLRNAESATNQFTLFSGE